MELTSRDEIMRRLTDTGSPTPRPPGGWTPDNVGPELGRLLREAQPIVVPLPPGFDVDEYLIQRALDECSDLPSSEGPYALNELEEAFRLGYRAALKRARG